MLCVLWASRHGKTHVCDNCDPGRPFLSLPYVQMFLIIWRVTSTSLTVFWNSLSSWSCGRRKLPTLPHFHRFNFSETGDFKFSWKTRPTVDLRNALKSPLNIDCECHWSFSRSWLQIFWKIGRSQEGSGVVNFFPHHDFEKIWKIWSHDPKNDRWHS